MMIERLLPGETYEVGNVYVGDRVLFVRSSIVNRAGKTRENEKKKEIVFGEK